MCSPRQGDHWLLTCREEQLDTPTVGSSKENRLLPTRAQRSHHVCGGAEGRSALARLEKKKM